MEAPGFPGVPAAPLLPAPRTPAPGAPAAPAPAPSPANAADDDGYCGVCGSAHSEEGDALLFCDGPGCGVAVHQLCYGIRALPPEDEPWFCEPCHCDSVAFEAARTAARPDAAPPSSGARAPTSLDFPRTERACAICSGGPDGPVVDAAAKIPLAFKRATTLPKSDAKTRDVGDAAWQDAWAHVACAAWIEEAGFADERRLSVALCGDLSAARGALRCELCGKRGQAVQCRRKKCVAAFHPACVLRELMGPKEWRGGGGGAARKGGAAKAIGDLLCGRHCGKGGRSAAPKCEVVVEKSDYEKERDARIARNAEFLQSLGLGGGAGGALSAGKAPPKKRASTPKAETTPSRKSSRAGSEHKPGMYAISRTGRSAEEIAEAREEKEQARLEKLLKRADRAVANAVADDAKHANRERRHEDARRHALEQAVLQEQRRILFQHQALLRAQQLEVLRQQRVQEREERERQVEEDRRAAALKRDAEKAARVADRAMAAMAVRDARRAAKFVKEMAKSQRSTELQRQRVESKVYRESLADAKARSKLAKTQKSSDAAQQADAIASESTVSVILEHEARRKGAPARAAPPAPAPPFAPPFAAGGAPAPWGAYDGAGAFAAASYAHAGYGGFDAPYAADYDFGGDFGAPPPLGPPPEAPRYAYASASYAAERAPPDAGLSYERGAPRSPAPSYCPVAAPPAAAPPQQLTAADVARLLPPCCFCGGDSNDPDSAEGAMIASVFLGPATKARPEGTLYRAHERCAELSPEVFLDDHGAYHNVVKAAKRGAQLRCFACDGRGATIGCHVASCQRSYHAPCAVSSRWRFGGLRRFWCAEHRGLAEGGGLADHDSRDATTVGRLLGAASGRWCPHCERFDPNALDGYVSCDGCNNWWHPACAQLDDEKRAWLAAHEGDPTATWHCPHCEARRAALENQVVCVCKASAASCQNTFMLMCDACDVWHHPACVGLSASEAGVLGESDALWHCPTCVAAGIICVCQARRRPGEVTLTCEGCAGEFHPKCVNVAEADVAAYGKPASDPDRKILICPACYDANRKKRGGDDAGDRPRAPPRRPAAPRGRKRCHGEPSGLRVRVAVSPKGARSKKRPRDAPLRVKRVALVLGGAAVRAGAGSLDDDDGDDGPRKPLAALPHGLWPEPVVVRYTALEPVAEAPAPAAGGADDAAGGAADAAGGAAPADADAAVAEAPADADAAMAEAPADATVEAADAEPPVADAMEDDSEAPLDV